MPTDVQFTAPFTVESQVGAKGPARITDFEDRLLLIHPRHVVAFTHPDGKTVDAIRADVLVLDGEDGPHLAGGLTVTQQVLARSLRRRLDAQPGRQVTTLARIVRVPNRRDASLPRVWVFDAPTETDVDLAQLYLDEHGDPFAPAA